MIFHFFIFFCFLHVSLLTFTRHFFFFIDYFFAAFRFALMPLRHFADIIIDAAMPAAASFISLY